MVEREAWTKAICWLDGACTRRHAAFLSGEASCGFSLIEPCSKFNLCTRGALPHIRSSICLKYQRDDVESSYSPGNRDPTDLKVWKAKEPGSDIVVALKMIKATDKEGNSCDVSCLLCMAAPSYRFFLCLVSSKYVALLLSSSLRGEDQADLA